MLGCLTDVGIDVDIALKMLCQGWTACECSCQLALDATWLRFTQMLLLHAITLKMLGWGGMITFMRAFTYVRCYLIDAR